MKEFKMKVSTSIVQFLKLSITKRLAAPQSSPPKEKSTKLILKTPSIRQRFIDKRGNNLHN